MPTNVVKTKSDEEKWSRAKAQAREQGQGENYAYIMSIYKKMKKGASMKRTKLGELLSRK